MRDSVRVVTDSQITLTTLERHLYLLNIQFVISNQTELPCWLSLAKTKQKKPYHYIIE